MIVGTGKRALEAWLPRRGNEASGYSRERFDKGSLPPATKQFSLSLMVDVWHSFTREPGFGAKTLCLVNVEINLKVLTHCSLLSCTQPFTKA